MKAPLVSVTKITHSKAMDSEIWITSDGRAYLVTLEGDSRPGPTDGLENHFSKVISFVIPVLGDIDLILG